MGARKSKEKGNVAQPLKTKDKQVKKKLKQKKGKGKQGKPGQSTGKPSDPSQKPQYLQNQDQSGNILSELNHAEEYSEEMLPQNLDEMDEADAFSHWKSQEPDWEEETSPYPVDEGCCRGSRGKNSAHRHWCQEHETETGTEDSGEILRLLRANHPESNKKAANVHNQDNCQPSTQLFHFNETSSETPKPVLPKYTKIFATQVDDGHERPARSSEEIMMWTSIFALRVFAVLSFIHFLQAGIFLFPVAVRYPIVVAVPALKWIWIFVIPIVFNISLSILSVMKFWGGSFPRNFFVLLLFVSLWTLFWTTVGCSFDEIVLHILLCIAFDCLFMAAATFVHTTLNPHSFMIYTLAAAAIFIQLLATMILANLGYIGDGTPEYSMNVICVATVLASPVFLYIVVDVNAILEGSRPVAWPHQWIFGVLCVYQDWVWMIGEGMQMLLYCFPCTYCKHSKHTVFRRWKFWNNNYQNLYGGNEH